MFTKLSRFLNLTIAMIMIVALFGTAGTATAQTTAPEIDPDAQYVPGEVVVGFPDGQATAAYAAQASALAGTVGAQVVAQSGNLALLSFAEDADVLALSSELSGVSGVAFAEPNYLYRIPEVIIPATQTEAPTTVTRTAGDGSTYEVSIADLRAMRSIKNGRIAATYPNDTYLWTWGWEYIDAEIVSTNTTPSKNVCVLDTGVDYLHPDLAGHILKGTDFVNNDLDPMDDNGHGTHAAGIITAISNNGKGIAGVAFNNKVVAVKVLNAQGWGTNYGISLGVYYCALRSDVHVLNMSLEGVSSSSLYNAVSYAVNTKGKLVVAAAGNYNSSTPAYPAGYATTFTNKVLAVAAIDDGSTASMGCRASYSNYGSWVSIVAPGTNIYSTTPYNRPFYMNYLEGVPASYASLSGTSMATPFVSAAAARAWGYLPVAHPLVLPAVWTNADIGYAVRTGSWWAVNANGACWPAEMAGIYRLNIAYLLERGAASGYIRDAYSGIPIPGATMQAYKNNVLVGSGLTSTTNPGSSLAEIINLPYGGTYTFKVNKAGYTLGSQPAFQHSSGDYYTGGSHTYLYQSIWMSVGTTYIPPLTGNISIAAGWGDNYYVYGSGDLDLDIWLPGTPNVLDPGQPAKFIVGDWDSASDYGFLEGDPTGTLFAFPFAIYNREGYATDGLYLESTTISNRKAHAPLAANAALPYYASSSTNPYWVELWDHGAMANATDTLIYATYPWVYVWKDGVIKGFAEDLEGCNEHQWWPFKIYGGVTGALTVQWVEGCGGGYYPYALGFDPAPVSKGR